jgi:protein TonB
MRLPLSFGFVLLSLASLATAQRTGSAAISLHPRFPSGSGSDSVSPPSTRVIQLGDSVELEPLKMAKPSYPSEARKSGIQGQVSLHVYISDVGIVENVKSLSGHPLLIPAAIAAVKKWRYKPFIRRGKPVKVSTTVLLDFALAKNVQEILLDAAAPQAERGTSLDPTTISAADMMSRLVHKVAPVYPSSAKRNHVEGTVVLQATVGSNGRISKLTVMSGPSELFESAIGAVQQWRYRPFVVNGEVSDVITEIQLSYELH